MMLAGLRVPTEDVRELASLVDEPTRSVLEVDELVRIAVGLSA